MGQAKQRAAVIAKLQHEGLSDIQLRSDEEIRGKAQYNIELDEHGDDYFTVYAFYCGENDIRLLYQEPNEALDDLKLRLEPLLNDGKPLFPTYLYRKGFARIYGVVGKQSLDESFLKTAETAIQEKVLTLYDVIWPEVAEENKRFADTIMGVVANNSLPRVKRSFIESLVSVGGARTLTHIELLERLLEQAKSKLREQGKLNTMLGIVPQSGATLFFSVKIPYEQRRFFRTVSEIAKRVQAQYVILVGDSRDKVDNTELLIARQVKSDGSCISIVSRYTHIASLGRETIAFSSNLTDPGTVQDLLLAWGGYSTGAKQPGLHN